MPQDRIHLIGIGGISMSGIARILLDQGYIISGSDLKDSHLLQELRAAGAEIKLGHLPAHVEGADMVVVSNAVPGDNPEVVTARKLGIPVLKRAEMIALLMEKKRGIAISGTHGKTTTTSMTATIFRKAGLDPTILVGGELESINGNAHLGRGDFLITEADESDGSFLYYHPEVVVVTNIEHDHHDYYDTTEKLHTKFKKFLNNTPPEGRVVIWAEDETLMKLVDPSDSRVLSYGFNSGVLRAEDLKLLPFGSYFNLVYQGQRLGEVNLQVPGRHNILNALAASAAALHAGLDFSKIKEGIASYAGVGRRFEKKGLIGSIMVIDDYAHHPSEIKATLRAARNTGYERIIAVFQPHRYSRTKHLLQDFSRAFDEADRLIVTDIYSAGEEPLPGVKAEDLVNIIARRGKPGVDYIASLEDVVSYLLKILKPRDMVITLGAGDVYRIGELLLDRMKKQREMA